MTDLPLTGAQVVMDAYGFSLIARRVATLDGARLVAAVEVREAPVISPRRVLPTAPEGRVVIRSALSTS